MELDGVPLQCWLACGLIVGFLTLWPRDSASHTELGPSTSINSQDRAAPFLPGLHIGLCDLDNPAGAPFSGKSGLVNLTVKKWDR